MTSATATPEVEHLDFDAEAAQQHIRDQLRRRINTHAQPSRLINLLADADLRCAQSTKALGRLIGRAPRVLGMIRAALRKAFELDPDSLLFTEAASPTAPAKVSSLTERALLTLALPSVPINLNQFTTLSLKGDPNRRLPYTPLQALHRVIALKLLDQLPLAVTQYWEALPSGSWLTRKEQWAALYAAAFADQAFIAQQLDELSSGSMTLLQQLIDAPSSEARQRAGGDWASVRVRQLMWPGSPTLAIPGALHIYREGEPEGAPHVIYLPALARNFYHYPSFFLLQCGLLTLVSQSLFDELWQCMPLSRRHELCRPTNTTPASSVVRGALISADALAFRSHALLEGQWANELACGLAINHAHVFSKASPRPQPLSMAPFLRSVERTRKQLVGRARLRDVCAPLLAWDGQRRREEIAFASGIQGLSRRCEEQLVQRYEKGLLALLSRNDLSADSAALQEVLALQRQRNEHMQAMVEQVKDARHQLVALPFWLARPSGGRRRVALFLRAQVQALRCEVQLQHRLKLISTAQRDLMSEVLDQPLARKRVGSKAQVLSISVGSAPDAFYPLHNLWVVTRATAVKHPSRAIPVVLYAFGHHGGVVAFSSLDALSRGLKASLKGADDSRLWGCVEHDKRHDLRAHAARDTLAVRYQPMQISPTGLSLKTLVMYYAGFDKHNIDSTSPLSDGKKVVLSRLQWTAELQHLIEFPSNRALTRALGNIEVLRKVAAEAKKSPPWLVGATGAQRREFKRLTRRYLGSAAASECLIALTLPGLETFARQALIARLTQDGFSELDIDQPLINMPDGVYSSFCANESRCSVGDRKIIVTPSLNRTTFSLLQLALHNLDPQAPWTRQRLNRARYLQPQWQQRLNTDYLIKTISSLDIGGSYAAHINRAFYPSGSSGQREERVPTLIKRTLWDRAQLQLFSAVVQGLSGAAQSLFKTAMQARTPQDLRKNGHRLTLSVVHLVGHTMLHDRYIAGIVVIQDQPSQRCLVYWPTAPHEQVITEYTSLQAARTALNRIAAAAELVKILARQVAPGWAFEAIVHEANAATEDIPLSELRYLLAGYVFVEGVWKGYEFIRSFSIKHLAPTPVCDEIEKLIHEQISSAPKNWLAVVPTSYSDVSELLYAASSLDLHGRTQAVSNSSWVLATYRIQRLQEQNETSRRALLGFFFPLFGMLNAFYELLLAARRYHRLGDPNDALDVAFMTLMLAIELIVDFAPGPKVKGVGAAVIRSPAAVLKRIRRLPLAMRSRLSDAVPFSVTQLKLLDRFKIKGKPEGAIALKSPGEQGVYVRNGEQFVANDTHYYPVYRRENEQVLRLRSNQEAGLDELVLTIDQPQEWLLGADAPQPGPSSGRLDPWHEPAPSPGWRPPSPRTTSEERIFQSRTTDNHWMQWRTQIHPAQLQSTPAAGIFEVGSSPRGSPLNTLFLRVAPPDTPIVHPDSGFYRMLPQGANASSSRFVFITRNEPPRSTAGADIVRWTSTDISDQPIPISRTQAGGWQNHPALFDKPLEQYVGEAFARMTSETQEFTVRRLIELAGPEHRATAGHLLGIRATLDEWLPSAPARPGQTDDLLRMLRSVRRGRQSTLVSYQGAAPGFERIDFLPPVRLEPALQHGGKRVRADRDIAQQAAVRTILEQQGFTLQAIVGRRNRRRITQESIAVHPNSPDVIYYLSYEWLQMGHVRLGNRLQNSWFNAGFNSMGSTQAARLSKALAENRLVRILAGIQWPIKGNVSPTVYFIKVAPSP